MRPRLSAAPCLLLLCSACIVGTDDGDTNAAQREPFARVAGAYRELETTREAVAPPPTVYAHVELSEFAVAHFWALELAVDVYSAEGLEGHGLRAEWLAEPGGEPVRANFGGPLAATWSAKLLVNSNPCSAAPCVLSLELAPEGEWRSELSFAMDYTVRARLEVLVNEVDYAALESAVEITLRHSP